MIPFILDKYTWLLILILILIILAFVIHQKYYRQESFIPTNDIIDMDVTTNLKSIMKTFDGIMVSYDIPYWVTGKSLLNVARFKDVAPWMNSMKVGMFTLDDEKFRCLRAQFAQNGLLLTWRWFGFRLYPFYGMNPFKFQRGYHPGELPDYVEDDQPYWNYNVPFIDVYLYVRRGDKAEFANRYNKGIWHKQWYKYDDLIPLKRIDWCDMSFFIPQNPHDFLKRVYGCYWCKDSKPVLERNSWNYPLLKWKVHGTMDYADDWGSIARGRNNINMWDETQG